MMLLGILRFTTILVTENFVSASVHLTPVRNHLELTFADTHFKHKF